VAARSALRILSAFSSAVRPARAFGLDAVGALKLIERTRDRRQWFT
jgi:hypothetical protein